MLFLYLSLLVLPLSFVLFERKFDGRRAVYYSGVLGGGAWLGLTLLISDHWSLIVEPILVISFSLISLSVRDERIFKYQPCITQVIFTVALSFNGALFNLGERYLPLMRELFRALADSEIYLQLNCALLRFIFYLQGRPLELEQCLDRLRFVVTTFETRIPWAEAINTCVDALVYPLLLHSAILAYVVYRELDSTIWLVARLAIYPLALLVASLTLGHLFT